MGTVITSEETAAAPVTQIQKATTATTPGSIQTEKMEFISPFLSICIAMIRKRRKEAIFAETVLCGGLLFLHMGSFAGVYDGRLLREMKLTLKVFGLESITGKSAVKSPYDLFVLLGIDTNYVRTAIYTCILAAFIFICGFFLTERRHIECSDYFDGKMLKKWYILRMIFNALLALFPMIFYLTYLAT